MTPEQFWQSTIAEISLFLKAMGKAEECRLKEAHILASLIGVAVRSEKGLPPFETLFSIQKSQEETSNIYAGWEDSKAFMKAIQKNRR